MKTQIKIFIVLFIATVAMGSTLFAKTMHHETATFKVYGNCTMCKKRIETALLKNQHIKSADWDVNTKMLTVTYDPHMISIDNIHKIVASAGHDTDKVKADDSTYKNLMGCCQYERKK